MPVVTELDEASFVEMEGKGKTDQRKDWPHFSTAARES